MNMQITTVIMAGGLSRRMGRDKGLLPFGYKPGEDAAKGEFVVGYGLDYNQMYRNLPDIGVLHPEIYTKAGE